MFAIKIDDKFENLKKNLFFHYSPYELNNKGEKFLLEKC